MIARRTSWWRWVASAASRGARWAGRREPPAEANLGRGPRRVLVGAMYASYVVTVAAAMATDWAVASRPSEAHVVRDVWMFVGVLAFGLSVFHLAANLGTKADLAGVSDAILDERLRQAKDAAFRTAYTILFWLALGALLVFALIIGAHLGHLPSFTAASVVLARCGLVVTLPSAVLAWRQPDPEPGAA